MCLSVCYTREADDLGVRVEIVDYIALDLNCCVLELGVLQD